MPSFNKVILIGNLTRDPELRYTQTGVAIAKISLAINRSWRAESGEMREEVTFVEVEAFRKQAETIAQYVKKGRPLMVEGRLKLDQWDDKQTGQKRSRLGVVLDSFQFLDSGGGRQQDDSGSSSGYSQPSTRRSSPPAPQQTSHSQPSSEPESDMAPQDDDDVPF